MFRSLIKSQYLLCKMPTTLRFGGVRAASVHLKNAYDAGTMADVKCEIMSRLGLEEGFQPLPKSREHLLKYGPKIENLPERTMQDSFTSATIPLSTDKSLQDKYVSFRDSIRKGRLMEDMDLFAVWVCHNHVKLNGLPKGVPLPYTFVTILVDDISFSDVLGVIHKDLRLSGHVSWVGRSSMEISIWLEQLHDGIGWKQITQAYFLMAARNATNTGAAAINPLKAANTDDAAILLGGDQRKKRRQLLQASSTFKVEPNDFEQSIMYQLYQRTSSMETMELNKRILPPNCRWMSDSYTVSTMASYPENRNAHHKVFGGFLMRIAMETSWVGAYRYSRSRPEFVHISDISFEKPVGINSLIKTTAYVVYTQANYMQLMTVVDVIDPESGLQLTSNVIYSTIRSKDTVAEVLPRSYHETMWYIQGRRKFQSAMKLEE